MDSILGEHDWNLRPYDDYSTWEHKVVWKDLVQDIDMDNDKSLWEALVSRNSISGIY